MVYAVIMAGGTGTRFWPRSRRHQPKPFLSLLDGESLLQQTAARLTGVVEPQRLLVVTNRRYTETVRSHLPDMPPASVIGEPMARNTAPCVLAAARILHHRDPDSVMIVLPSDHHIGDVESFRSLLGAAVQTASRTESLVTIGIRPDRPETGYGYIRYDASSMNDESGHRHHPVTRFTEKPDEQTARRFLEAGDYLWNSGMFIWRSDVILKAFETHRPDLFSLLGHLGEGEPSDEQIERFYKAAPSVSIDYAIMENARQVRVFPADFGWSDLGSWQAAYQLAPKDGEGNAVRAAETFLHDSSGNLVQSENGKLIALVGVDRLAVVETEDAILVCNLERSQEVRYVIEHLESLEQLRKYL